MPLRIDILTLFPGMFGPFLGTSIPRRAADKGLVDYHLTDIRSFATDAHQSVDDRPFGGGPGMVMMCQTLYDAIERVEAADERQARRILLTPQGKVFDQALATDLSKQDRLLLVAGHYEGFDQRIVDGLAPMELSIGDYVLSGGELAAMVVIEAVVRLIPGVLGAATGSADESFEGGLLEYPQYTRPREFRGLDVPPVLLSGDHAAIALWRSEQRKIRTRLMRPDLWARYLAANADSSKPSSPRASLEMP